MAKKERARSLATIPELDDDGPTSMGISVREIGNGYVTSKYEDGPSGYHSNEVFTPNKPNLEEALGKVRAAPPEVNHLKAAVGLLKGKRA